jgi:hypothetical protein
MSQSGEAEAFEREAVRSKLLDDLVSKCELRYVAPKLEEEESQGEAIAESTSVNS